MKPTSAQLLAENRRLKKTLTELTARITAVTMELKLSEVGFVIGDFRLSRGKDAKGNLWITRTNGEAMECSGERAEALETVLEQFWEATF